MKIQFIAQGLDQNKSKRAGDVLNEVLTKEPATYNSFAAFVAFVSIDGIKQLQDGFSHFIDAGGHIRLYVGVDLHGTSKEALELLLSLDGIESYVVYSTNRIVYHPKVYSFEGQDMNMVIVGSSNLTLSGLYQNVESSICIESDNAEDEGKSVISDIYDYYNTLLDNSSTSCQKLTKEVIDILCKNKVVLETKERRENTNEYSKKNEVSLEDNEELKSKFQKLKFTKTKPTGRKAISEEIFSAGENEKTTVYTQAVEISGNSMWIETKEMTGGSRNILDLSKKGMRDGNRKIGSVEFFGLDKNDYTTEKNIDLVYDGKIFRGNTIKYADGNSNWRIQIKGETDDGIKMTYLSSPKLGIPGGLTQKILIFEKTDVQDRYILHIYDKSELEELQEMSTDWAFGGSGNGRIYGFLN